MVKMNIGKITIEVYCHGVSIIYVLLYGAKRTMYGPVCPFELYWYFQPIDVYYHSVSS